MQKRTDLKVCVVGLGYVGLPTAAVLASRGFKVHGVEVRADVVDVINSGRAHVVEPDLDLLVRASVQTGNLKAYLQPTESDVFLICVPTPMTEDHRAELSMVYSATRAVCPYLRPGNLVVLESTSPPGTTEEMARIIKEETNLSSPDVMVAHAPERVLPGKVIREVVENDRIVGGVDAASTEACANFYRNFVTGDILPTDCRTAETAKLVENSYRDVNIAFANELSILCDELKLDVWELINLANRHPRVNILSPGCGVGGHCIAIDPWFLVEKAPKATPLIRTAREVNIGKAHHVVDRVRRVADRFKSPKIACLGLAYKPDIDDLRESPAVEIVEMLQKEKVGTPLVVEPYVDRHPNFDLVSLNDALAQADIVLALVGHKPFKMVAPNLLAEKVIIDTCGVFRQHSSHA